MNRPSRPTIGPTPTCRRSRCDVKETVMNPQRIAFTKMTGSGNDFIVIDNRGYRFDRAKGSDLARLACRRRLSAGADGLILINEDPEVDFQWNFFNSDGSDAEMCGNGSRCAARFARLHGIASGDRMSFRTLAGVIDARILGERVKVRLPGPHGLALDLRLDVQDQALCLHFINTGVPHIVNFVEDEDALEKIDVFGLGRALRYHPKFQPSGTNADFAWVRDPHTIAVRTYERGVEAETLACGTGSIACVLTAAARQLVASPVAVRTRSGETLVVHFEKSAGAGAIEFPEVYLEGDAKVVYEAELWDETLKD
jgi:diaminopimelate epimerase